MVTPDDVQVVRRPRDLNSSHSKAREIRYLRSAVECRGIVRAGTLGVKAQVQIKTNQFLRKVILFIFTFESFSHSVALAADPEHSM